MTIEIDGYFYSGPVSKWRDYARTLSGGKRILYRRGPLYGNQSLPGSSTISADHGKLTSRYRNLSLSDLLGCNGPTGTSPLSSTSLLRPRSLPRIIRRPSLLSEVCLHQRGLHEQTEIHDFSGLTKGYYDRLPGQGRDVPYPAPRRQSLRSCTTSSRLVNTFVWVCVH